METPNSYLLKMNHLRYCSHIATVHVDKLYTKISIFSRTWFLGWTGRQACRLHRRCKLKYFHHSQYWQWASEKFPRPLTAYPFRWLNDRPVTRYKPSLSKGGITSVSSRHRVRSSPVPLPVHAPKKGCPVSAGGPPWEQILRAAALRLR